ncbi:MAG: hypothetical protein DRI86_15905 [Bacteroidetes bacterium]|nr:MAG: hypothetical protein DRI86_15905 [Bacteroidota bacterium]
MENYFEDKYAIVYHAPAIKAVLVEWKSFKTIPIEDYKQVFNKAQELLIANRPENFIADNRLQGIINPEQRKWLEEVSLPESARIGMKRIAVISDMNVFKRYYLNKLLASVNKFKIPFKIFKEIDLAIEWIKKLDKSL